MARCTDGAFVSATHVQCLGPQDVARGPELGHDPIPSPLHEPAAPGRGGRQTGGGCPAPRRERTHLSSLSYHSRRNCKYRLVTGFARPAIDMVYPEGLQSRAGSARVPSVAGRSCGAMATPEVDMHAVRAACLRFGRGPGRELTAWRVQLRKGIAAELKARYRQDALAACDRAREEGARRMKEKMERGMGQLRAGLEAAQADAR